MPPDKLDWAPYPYKLPSTCMTRRGERALPSLLPTIKNSAKCLRKMRAVRCARLLRRSSRRREPPWQRRQNNYLLCFGELLARCVSMFLLASNPLCTGYELSANQQRHLFPEIVSIRSMLLAAALRGLFRSILHLLENSSE